MNNRSPKQIPDVRDRFAYDSQTGAITRKTSQGRWKAGEQVGYVNKRGYLVVQLGKNNLVYGHRLAWFLHYGEQPPHTLDHINQDKSDNRIANLRAVDNSENIMNGPIRKDNTTGVRGVRTCTQTGMYKVVYKGKWGGRHKTLKEAKVARERLENEEA